MVFYVIKKVMNIVEALLANPCFRTIGYSLKNDAFLFMCLPAGVCLPRDICVCFQFCLFQSKVRL